MDAPGPIVLLGASSLVGWHIYQAAPDIVVPVVNSHQKHPLTKSWHRANLDDGESLRQLFATLQPRIVIHAAGICEVDRCERDPAWATTINVDGTARIIDAMPSTARLLYVSSDHVFAGATAPCFEGADPQPTSVYGRSRVAAEALIRQRNDHLIVRPGLGIGPSLSGRYGHLDWLRHRLPRGLPASVVVDEWRRVVDVVALGQRIVALATSEVSGLRHLVGQQLCNRVMLAKYLQASLGIPGELTTTTRAAQDYPHPGRMDLRTRYQDALALALPGLEQVCCRIRQ